MFWKHILLLGALGLIVGGPIGLAGRAVIVRLVAYEYERHMWKKVLVVVKKESKAQPTLESIDHYYPTIG
ncbi:MAG: hypothetical protein ACJ707_01620 [Nitrososphaera sp.]